MKTQRIFLISFICLLGLLFVLGMGVNPAGASTLITVNSTSDLVAEDGECSLREAVMNANGDNQSGSTDCPAGSGADVIEFSLPAGSVISVTDQPGTTPNEILISDDLTINGPGAGQLAIAQDNTHNQRLFHVTAGVNFTLTRITVRDIHAFSTGQNGAGIWNEDGVVNIDRVHFINNQNNNGGAAIDSDGELFVESSEFHRNQVGSSSSGAINVRGHATIRNSYFYSNTSTNGSGAIGVSLATSYLTVENSIFLQNLTNNDGGAIGVGAGNPHAHISHSTFQDNICNECEGGAIANSGFMTLINSTLSGNTARTGGGLYASAQGTNMYGTTLIHTTIANNTSTGGPGSGGGLYTRRSGSFALLNFQMYGSIVANNSGSTDCDYLEGGGWNGVITSNGYNFVESGCEVFFSEATDQPGVDPMLDGLANNGGLLAPTMPPFTHALLAGSPAIDVNDCNGGTVVLDGRYAPRPVDSQCDAGVYEFNGIPPTTITYLYLPIASHEAPAMPVVVTGSLLGISLLALFVWYRRDSG